MQRPQEALDGPDVSHGRAATTAVAEASPVARRPIWRALPLLRGLSPFVLFWLAPVWAGIGLASLAIALVPMKRLTRIFGENLGAVAVVPLAGERDRRRAIEIGQTVRIAAGRAPFRADCFPTAIVGQLLCRLYRVPAALHLGVKLSSVGTDPRLAAHAWVVSDRVFVTGGRENFARYAPLGCWTVALR